MLPYELPADGSVLLDRAIFKLSGSDAQRYLNGQCTQDVSLATEKNAVYALVTNFKGKLDGDCFIRRHQSDLVIDCPVELREALFTRLDRYIIADDAELSDITEDYELLHTIGEAPEAGWICNRFGQSGYDTLHLKSKAPQSNLSHSEVEKSRISHAVPLWGAELNNNVLPPEAGLEARAISYTKGCYTGQEVISRMRSAGKTNRHLVLLELSSPENTGTPLLCDGASEAKPAGNMTSICNIDGKQIALAYRKRKYQDTQNFNIGKSQATILS
ncbi:CAF17-like 4Fe-4S cluster assembly/insertion protein YgfZ [Rubritalea sp.]|uniref:CAF17-like 4Fe-4S cluster assembly/insertion protein YgfZ n=1 Tax=Rubritalea sp. TaxID=2109375 RepID=UPI003EF731EC